MGTRRHARDLHCLESSERESWGIVDTIPGLPGVNHLAYEVDDVEGLCQRMKTAGYRESTPLNAHRHRKRRYFYDSEGNDWEFVQYLSQDPAERNDYELPDQ
jgi:catechol 2,3-dioxygenase-like lactoylglutathione lyase family enzyme